MTEHSETALGAEIRRLEEGLLTPQVRSSASALSALIADDFVEYGSSGRVWTKAQIIGALPAEKTARYTVSNFRARQLNAETVLATYRVTRFSEGETRHSLRSSIWVRRADRWQLVFQQGTPIPEKPF